MRTFVLFLIIFVLNLLATELITPIPQSIKYNKPKAKLGKKLFYDTLLSKNGTVSCASCHIIEAGGDDDLPVSTGINGQKGSRNAPTVLNAVFNFTQFWDGRAKDLKEQAYGPVENPVEMGDSWDNVVKKIKNNKFYSEEFNKLYKDGVTKENITDAIAEYEKTLITPNSPFDRYLRGEKRAINIKAKIGFKLFKSYGCISCHNGVNLGGNLYQKMGIFSKIKPKDKGRFEVTHNKNDLYYFKVPSLRNIAKTAPYMHDGSVKTLSGAIAIMLKFQLGINKVNKKDIKYIEEFLKTLSADVKGFE